MKKYLVGLLTAFLFTSAVTYADQRQDEVKAVQKLSQYDQKCAQFDKSACQTLLNSLGGLCEKSNSFACFRLAEIASINSEVAAREGNKAASVNWLDIAVGSTKKACKLKLAQACTQLKTFKKDFTDACKKGDRFFCQARKKL